MKNKLLKKLTLPVFLLIGSFIYAQTVTGTVSDTSGPLPGANITVDGTSTGTVTDFDGNFELAASSGDVLVFSFVGYVTQKISYTGQPSITVTLAEDAALLDEVVIIGYGTTTVKDATGSVASVKSGDFNKGVIGSPEQLIAGKVAGVQISQSSGEPGAGISLRIRGTGSVRANNSPLFVVDGVPVSNESTSASGADVGAGTGGSKNPLNFLNPNDIESMSVLKDASATAIYGSRGANGVVVITTKSGKSGGAEGLFSFSTSFSVSEVADRYNLLNAEEFVARGGADLGGATDWQDYIFRSPGSTDNSLSYSNNYGSGNVRATVGFSKQLGVVEDTSLERFSARVNLNHRFLDDKLKLSLQTTYSSVGDQQPFVTSTSGSTGDLLASAYYSNPTLAADPDFNTAPDRNPANLLAYYQDKTRTNRFLGNLSLNYDFTDEFSGKVTLGLDTSESVRGQAVGPQIIAMEDGAAGNGRAAVSNLDTKNELLELTFNYNKEFENSKLEALVGYSYQNFNRKGQNILGLGYSSTDLGEIINITEQAYNATRNFAGGYQAYGVGVFEDTGLNQTRVLSLTPNVADTASAAQNIPVDALTVDTFDNTDELQSFFGRINYAIANKYLFTGTIRADGSTRFGKDNQYGYFPSAAFAWKLNEEDFIGETFSTLKLRLSWGITGNQDGVGYGNYVNRTRWGAPLQATALTISSNGQISSPATTEVAFSNPDLKWESTAQYGFGVDFGFGNDRFKGTIDVYRKETSDILLNLPAVQPATTPFVFQNVDAVIVNQGVEFGLDYDIVRNDNVNWNVNFNIAFNDNEFTDYDGPNLQAGTLFGQGLTDATSQILTEGKSLFTYNLREVDENFNVDAEPTILDKSGLPDITAGFSTGASYKNWDASLYFSGQFGHYVYNNTANALFSGPQLGSRNNLKDIVDGGVILSSTNPSTHFLESGDFVRLQNASIGYQVPLKEGSAVKSLRLSLTGQNLFLITDYSGLDPEVSTTNVPSNGLPSASIDYVSYPRSRTYSFGLNLTF